MARKKRSNERVAENLKRRLVNRRNFFGLCGAGAMGLGYARFVEEEWLEVNQPKLPLVTGGREIRVLHLSDIHASPVVSLPYIQRAVELGVSLKPDLICLTGDFITARYDCFAEYGAILKKLGDAAPSFACMGNHDGGSWVRRHGYADWSLVGEMLKSAGVTVMHNTSRVLEVNERTIQIVGLGDLWAEEINPGKAFEQALPNLRTILLSHNPDSKAHLGAYKWDLMLSGHTHGGQLYLPIIGSPFAPVQDKAYVAGLKAWRDRWIHVTKGVGNLHGMRINCRPEISLVRILV